MNVLVNGVAMTRAEAEKADAYLESQQARQPQQWMHLQRQRDALKPILEPETAYDACVSH